MWRCLVRGCQNVQGCGDKWQRTQDPQQVSSEVPRRLSVTEEGEEGQEVCAVLESHAFWKSWSAGAKAKRKVLEWERARGTTYRDTHYENTTTNPLLCLPTGNTIEKHGSHVCPCVWHWIRPKQELLVADCSCHLKGRMALESFSSTCPLKLDSNLALYWHNVTF